MRAIVLAGGKGTRLSRLVPDRPKPMALVGGRPMLEYILDRLIAGGINEIVLAVGYRAEVIRNHFGPRWGGAAIAYAEEAEPLGTGGAVAHAVADQPGEAMLVVNGDTFLNLDFAALLAWYDRQASESAAAMVLCAVADTARYGAVSCSAGEVTGFSEKGVGGPGLINAGVYVLDPAVFDRFALKGAFSLETDLFQRHLDALRPKAFVTDSFFIDIGVEEDFLKAQTEIPAHMTGPL